MSHDRTRLQVPPTSRRLSRIFEFVAMRMNPRIATHGRPTLTVPFISASPPRSCRLVSAEPRVVGVDQEVDVGNDHRTSCRERSLRFQLVKELIEPVGVDCPA